jgi:hypothetical protein
MSTMTVIDHYEPLPTFMFDTDAPSEHGFSIDADDKATWAAQKIIQAENRIEKRQELANRYIMRITEWLTQANQPDVESVQYLKSLLKPWLTQALAQGSRLRSIKLLGATVGLRKRPDRVEIYDPDATMAWCEQKLPRAIVVKKDLSKTIIKDWLHTGQIIPGTNLAVGEDELTIKGA